MRAPKQRTKEKSPILKSWMVSCPAPQRWAVLCIFAEYDFFLNLHLRWLWLGANFHCINLFSLALPVACTFPLVYKIPYYWDNFILYIGLLISYFSVLDQHYDKHTCHYIYVCVFLNVCYRDNIFKISLCFFLQHLPKSDLIHSDQFETSTHQGLQ